MAVIDEPAAAIAAGRCLTARSLSKRPGGEFERDNHPRRCDWCDFPLDVLAALIDGFNDWAWFKPRTNTYARYDAQTWAEMARRHPEQAEAEIVAAQGLEPVTERNEPPAHESPPAPTAPPVDKELAAWTT